MVPSAFAVRRPRAGLAAFVLHGLWLALVLAALTGCPRGTRRTLVPEIPSSGDPDARSRFVSARASFLRDGTGAEELEAIASEFPNDPIAPFAQLYAGMARLKERDLEAAERSLRQLLETERDDRLVARANLYLGLTLSYRGERKQALPLLRRSEPAVDGDDERGEYLAALAETTAAVDGLAALPVYDQWYRLATPIERAYIVERVEALVAAADERELDDAWQAAADDKGPARASLGPRVAARREAAGKPGEARELRAQAAKLRARLGLPPVSAISAAGEPGPVGAILPLVGKQSRVGEAAALGLSLVAGAGDGRAQAIVEVRQADTPEQATAAYDELVDAGVVAVVGPMAGPAVDAVIGRAEKAQVPVMSLASRPEERVSSRFAFHLMHSAEARARALARRAVALGIRKLAVLAPDSGYGRAVGAAFSSEVTRRGGAVVVTHAYPPDTRSFTAAVKKLEGSWQGVFVPEQADVLELIAPALAAAGLVARPPGEKKAIGGRPIVLLSTAEGLAEDFAVDAGRNSVGALLAPGFYPDPADPVAKGFIERFFAAHGKAPGAIDAYAYDAAQLVAATGGRTAAAVLEQLGGIALSGVTGAVSFDADHRRADDGVLYTVVATEDGAGYLVTVLGDEAAPRAGQGR